MKIYLAGGMKTNWQDRVKSKIPSFEYFDPREKGETAQTSLEAYGTWDLTRIRQCDIVFAYMERTNPSGIGMACEIGYAFGIGKTVILCLENDNPHMPHRYLKFMKKVSHITFDDFKNAIDYLGTFI